MTMLSKASGATTRERKCRAMSKCAQIVAKLNSIKKRRLAASPSSNKLRSSEEAPKKVMFANHPDITKTPGKPR